MAGLALLLVALFYVFVGFPFSADMPALKGFNFRGGLVVIPEFAALLLALSLYTAAFIAEIVRAGIMSVNKGQTEAASALGLPEARTLNLVVLPQALRVIIPPLTSQYLNLTKNSLAVAIAYPDIVSVFAGTTLTQVGQAVEIIFITMMIYLTLSLLTSFAMNQYNRRVALVGAEYMTAWTPSPARPAPVNTIGAWGWVRRNLMATPRDMVMTLLAVAVFLFWLLDVVIGWAFLNASFTGVDRSACLKQVQGACWPFIEAKFGQFIYGRYPEAERRVNLVFAAGIIGLLPMLIPAAPYKRVNAVSWVFRSLPLRC